MALSRFGLASTATVPAGTASAVGQYGTVTWSGAAEGFPVTFVKGTAIEFAPATTAGAALQSAIGAGNLRAYVQGQDDRGGAALAN